MYNYYRDKGVKNKMKGYLVMRLFKEMNSNMGLPIKMETKSILGVILVFRKYEDALKIAGDEELIYEVETREDLDEEIKAKTTKKQVV